jgi:hypothetical protein
MNSIRRHIPASIDTDAVPALCSFNNTDALLLVPWVASWKAMRGFERFSMSDELLMAELSDGSSWVVGYVLEPAAIELPVWRGK